MNELGIPAATPQARLFANGGLEETDAYVYIRLGDYAGFTFVSRYDLNGGQLVKQNGRFENVGPHFIERDYLLRLISRCNCWAAEFGVSDRFDTGETLYRFQITLLGLGSFGQGAGRQLHRLRSAAGPRAAARLRPSGEATSDGGCRALGSGRAGGLA